MNEQALMARALQLAQKGLYSTDPNPRVGAVLAKAGQIIAEGWHHSAGGPHAEIVALNRAKGQATGASAYVTLEPCAHHGRTPPCCDALIAAGVARVVVASEDPNPQVAGRGLQRLQQAGIEVVSGVLQSQAEALNPGFFKRHRSALPWVRGKLAMSLDGRTAMASGESQWITAEAARLDGQRLRARSSAMMTGIGTILADNPRLNVRLEGVSRQPLRVVLDPHLSTPVNANILQPGARVVIATTSQESEAYLPLQQQGAEILYLPSGVVDVIDLAGLLHQLAERECNEIHLEAGATLAGSMLVGGFMDELVIYMAPKLLGNSARGLFHLPELTELAQAIELELVDIRPLGHDWRLTLRPKPSR
ncbi:bifunctional diaminohydroxyphosphoribosylaminopyrimidine deaminase/5-amino-6-(5-phosphoribosylamino)uracil reductase RibD [Ectothiorhodospiraceae bacterium BW-2]|nr:bifunctional diaminohydroxyphosphoribosylaminopyrimidine deaminase/5-amino-6-(5-phosphoribosylamino)uracil reductase RibD [Ectothiorhodospiraceae bacterium BW-2]